MAINNTTTLKRLVQQYKEWADAHPMVNKFGYGDFIDLFTTGERIYPYVMVNCSNISDDQWYIKFQIEIFIAEWVYDERTNQLPAESNMLEILRHLTNTVRYSERWNQFSKLQGEQSGFKVIERGGDKITGWGSTHNIWIKRKSGICDLLTLMPEYDFGSQTSSGCSPVTLFINNVEEETIQSGTDFYLTVVDDNDVEVGTYDEATNTVTVPAAGSGIASQTFNGGAVTNQNSGTTKAITVKDSVGANVGTKGTDTALALDITISDAEIQINTVPVDQVEAEGVKNIDVVDSTSAPTGNWNGTAWEIDNSTINVNGAQIASTPPASVVNLNVHDSAGADVGTINGLTIEIDDVTVDNSDVSYTVDIPAEGVFVLPDVTVTINGASQGSFPSVKDLSITASNIIYIRPANSGYGTTSYLTGDEGYNETNYPSPSAPAFGVPAYLDPSNPKMLLNNNAFGHKHRFTGVNGGYYDYNTAQYKLADGTVSNQATTFGTTAGLTSYMIDHHTGLGWKWNTQGATIWSTQVTNILGLTHAGFTDYFLPSRMQFFSLNAVANLGTGMTSLIPFNSAGISKTSTPSFGNETTSHNSVTGWPTYTQTRADANADGAYACRWHF